MSPADSATRDLILDAAEPLFARRGYAATTIKQIGAAAGVNAALLYYYFADKETLYRELLRRLLGELVAHGMRRIADDDTPEAAIRHLVEVQVEFLSAHPHRPALLVREMVDHEAAHAEEQIVQTVARLFHRLCALIEQGQREGRFRADVDPSFAAISTVAQVVYVFLARPAIGLVLGYGADGLPRERVEAFGRHAADFALAALRAPEAPAPRARSRAGGRPRAPR